MLLFYNRQVYLTDEYDKSIIQKELEIERYHLHSEKIFFEVEKHQLEDQSNRSSLEMGFTDKNYTWYQTSWVANAPGKR